MKNADGKSVPAAESWNIVVLLWRGRWRGMHRTAAIHVTLMGNAVGWSRCARRVCHSRGKIDRWPARRMRRPSSVSGEWNFPDLATYVVFFPLAYCSHTRARRAIVCRSMQVATNNMFRFSVTWSVCTCNSFLYSVELCSCYFNFSLRCHEQCFRLANCDFSLLISWLFSV